MDQKPKSVKKAAPKKKAAVNKTPAKKSVASKKKAVKKNSTNPQVSLRERYEMIATMAYYRAETHNFEPGHDTADWLECEAVVDNMLKK